MSERVGLRGHVKEGVLLVANPKGPRYCYGDTFPNHNRNS